jgi:hypothetical protein
LFATTILKTNKRKKNVLEIIPNAKIATTIIVFKIAIKIEAINSIIPGPIFQKILTANVIKIHTLSSSLVHLKLRVYINNTIAL